jgi:phage portal protein BeeE
MNSNYRVNELSRTDYLRLYTGWVYVATSTISDSIAELEFNTLRGEKETEHKYNNLITYDFLKKVSSFMLLNGNCFVYKEMI